MICVVLGTLAVIALSAPGVIYYRRKWAEEDKRWAEEDEIAQEYWDEVAAKRAADLARARAKRAAALQ
jgi:hypothetical protein